MNRFHILIHSSDFCFYEFQYISFGLGLFPPWLDKWADEDVQNLPLVSKDTSITTRLGLSQTILDNIELEYNEQRFTINSQEHSKYSNILDISLKEFSFGKGEEIFNRSKHIWDKFLNRTSSYKYDGLIYTPCDLAVGYDDTLDFDLKTNITWFMNFKWKPPYENTIDFVVKEEKELISEFNTNKIEKSKVRVKSSVDTRGTRHDGARWFQVVNKIFTFSVYCILGQV